jgi:SAM-dependent methyltransferase
MSPATGYAARMMDAEKFTGERPGWGEGFDYDYARHIAAYRFAATRAAGRRVLDAGCGEGFGTQTLADIASQVLGVDYSPVAVAECRRLWNKPNLRFQQVNLTEPGTFSETFDVVVNFQVLEHIDDPMPFLRGLRERVGESGVLILTTPNRLRTISENPYHVREYTAPELKDLLSQVFGKVEITGVHGNSKVEEFEAGRARAVQRILRLDPLGIRKVLPEKVIHFAFAKLAKVVRRQARPSSQPDMAPEDFFIAPEPIDRALDLVAVCSR